MNTVEIEPRKNKGSSANDKCSSCKRPFEKDKLILINQKDNYRVCESCDREIAWTPSSFYPDEDGNDITVEVLRRIHSGN